MRRSRAEHSTHNRFRGARPTCAHVPACDLVAEPSEEACRASEIDCAEVPWRAYHLVSRSAAFVCQVACRIRLLQCRTLIAEVPSFAITLLHPSDRSRGGWLAQPIIQVILYYPIDHKASRFSARFRHSLPPPTRSVPTRCSREGTGGGLATSRRWGSSAGTRDHPLLTLPLPAVPPGVRIERTGHHTYLFGCSSLQGA